MTMLSATRRTHPTRKEISSRVLNSKIRHIQILTVILEGHGSQAIYQPATITVSVATLSHALQVELSRDRHKVCIGEYQRGDLLSWTKTDAYGGVRMGIMFHLLSDFCRK